MLVAQSRTRLMARLHRLRSRGCGLMIRSSALSTFVPTPSHVKRHDNFAQLSPEHVSHFRSIDGLQVIDDSEELESYNCDWLRTYRGHSKLALRPSTTEQLSSILRYCNENRIAVVPQGGNTGLVGGSVPVFDEVVVSMSRMNKIISFDETSGILTCEAGCILQTLDEYLRERGFIMPLDLGAKGSCQIGGNVSTNAGGIRFLRYGSLHSNTLGLETVLPNGTILNSLTTLPKDNTGYDLRQLFIGSEGTLGIVSKVAIAAARKPKSINVALLGLPDFASVLSTVQLVRTNLSEIVSAIEFIDKQAFDLVFKHDTGARNPLSSSHPFHLLIETSGSNNDHDTEKLTGFLESAFNDGLVSDGVVGQDETQTRDMWHIRETITESLQKEREYRNLKYDVSLPIKSFYKIVDDLRAKVGSRANVFSFGHLGDGNIHLNVCVPKEDEATAKEVDDYVYNRTIELKGSISAEHGIGLMKAAKLPLSKSKEAIDTMRTLKSVLDPSGILNPYKIFA